MKLHEMFYGQVMGMRAIPSMMFYLEYQEKEDSDFTHHYIIAKKIVFPMTKNDRIKFLEKYEYFQYDDIVNADNKFPRFRLKDKE